MMKANKVMVFGTFDILHPGHLHFFKQAKKLGNFLVVSIARDKNARKFKGYKPTLGEEDRLEVIRSLKIVDKAILGSKTNYLEHILRERPSVIALGYDQRAFTGELARDIKSRNLKIKVVRLKPYKAARYKSSVYKRKIKK